MACPIVQNLWTTGILPRHPVGMGEEHGSSATDPLGEALHFLRMSGTFYCRSELTAPWALAIPARRDCLSFHVLTAGQCWLEIEGSESRLLHPEDFALVPHGEGHRLASDPATRAPPFEQLPYETVSNLYGIIRHGGGGDASTLICGAVRFDHPAAHQLVKLLPRVIHIESSSSPRMEWMQSTLQLMGTEARELRPGGETVITRLADILVIQAIRSWIERDPAAQTGWVGALQDKPIGRAIALIHRDPAHAWTVAALAAAVGMSRSGFAARFADLVGEPPMQYLGRWRMHMAVTWLREEDAGVADLASRLGYQSEAAFSRAFKRFVGVSPGTVRRERATAAAATRG